MKAWPIPLVALVVLLIAASPRVSDTAALMRQGHAAFARGDWKAAAELYDAASLRATDPVPATLCMAAAKYHLALAGEVPTNELREAELLYRSCVDSTGEQRAEALYGVGNCLLQRAGQDAKLLREALRCYDECCKVGDATLRAAAAHNRERAALLLLQIAPAQAKNSDEAPPNDTSPQTPQRPDQGDERSLQGPWSAERSGAKDRTLPAKPEPGAAPTPTDQPPPPGAGNLPPVPDSPDLPPLAAPDAAAHLKEAHDRIARERQNHRRQGGRPVSEDVPGW
jgi:hypothetical protein